MSKTPHLILRGSIYYFRARVPQELVSSYGRAMISVSLATGDRAIAKERLAAKLDEFHREVAGIRRQSRKLADGYTGTVIHLTDEDIDRLCLQYRAEKLAEDEIQRLRGMDEEQYRLDLAVLEDGMPGLRDDYARGNLASVQNSLNTFLQSIALRTPRGTPTYDRLARRF